MTRSSIIITFIYTILLIWGAGITMRQVWQGFYQPMSLLNPYFRNKQVLWIFIFHLCVASTDLFICGPLSLYYKSLLWYWGGRIALFSSSLALLAYFNRNSQSYGKFIGHWSTFRNSAEIILHVIVGCMAVNWFYNYMLLWWMVAYRYLEHGPRRLIQWLYNTPEKRSARPWAPALLWVTIVSIYIFAFFAIYNQKVIYAIPPVDSLAPHVPSMLEWGIVITINLVIFIINFAFIIYWALLKQDKLK
jgi:hypothetical protein